MTIEGGCYCGELRYVSTGAPVAQGQCHCRECQYFTGGHPNALIAVPANGFRFVKGTPREFARDDLETPVTRLFCPTCGTHIGNPSPFRPDIMILKVGTLDDPSGFQPELAIFAVDKQPFHHLPDGLPHHDRRPA